MNGATLRVTLPWRADRRYGPRNVFPMYFDAHPAIGELTTFDIAPGRSTTTSEFALPVSGRLLYLGGHIHDYGIELRLEDAEDNTVLARLKTVRADDGRVRSVGRITFYKDGGLRLTADHRYRVVAVYDNPTCSTQSGAMGILVSVFTPDDKTPWPAVDTTDASYKKDLAWMMEDGGPGAGEAHRHKGDVATPSCAARQSNK